MATPIANCSTKDGTPRLRSFLTAEEAEQNNVFKTRTKLCQNVKLGEIVLLTIILVIGVALGLSTLHTGINDAKQAASFDFEKNAAVDVDGLKSAFNEYVSTAALMYHYCYTANCTGEMFRSLHEVNLGNKLQYQAMGFLRNISHDERANLENQTSEHLLRFFPEIVANFTGLTGYENQHTSEIEKRSEQPFYFPVLLMEPNQVENKNYIGFDLYSHAASKHSIDKALTDQMPTVTARLHLDDAFSVILFHPGNQNSMMSNESNRYLSYFLIRISDLLDAAFGHSDYASAERFMFDSTNLDENSNPTFLGCKVPDLDHPNDHGGRHSEFADSCFNVKYPEIQKFKSNTDYLYYEATLQFSQAEWTIVLMQEKILDHTAVILGSSLIIVCSVLVAGGMLCVLKHNQQISIMKTNAKQAESEMRIKCEQDKNNAERNLNIYLAHQVKNPLAAAIHASSFVDEAVTKYNMFKTEPKDGSVFNDSENFVEEIRQDVSVISTKLKLINQLMGNTLDLHQAQRGVIEIKYGTVFILKDVFEPVKEMLNHTRAQRGFEIILDCSPSLCITGDCIRLKQIVLNIAANASNFVTKGFIRMKAQQLNENTIDIIIEDSGQGIPSESHDRLFQKYEVSLQTVTQYCGIALCLCKKLVQKMNGDIWLDESYNSGIPDFPGARLVVRLNTQLIYRTLNDPSNQPEEPNKLSENRITFYNANSTCSNKINVLKRNELPTGLKVLIVDDETVLRTLFKRIILRVCPEWKVEEASSGEEAIEKTSQTVYDMIFMDQYMTDSNKRLLGTETVLELRRSGVNAIVVGLSANDTSEHKFYEAGANFFVRKPFPFGKKDCAEVLLTCLGSNG